MQYKIKFNMTTAGLLSFARAIRVLDVWDSRCAEVVFNDIDDLQVACSASGLNSFEA